MTAATETGLTSAQILATKVRGTDVYNPDGDHLGHIDDIVLDKMSGHAKYAIMSFGGFLGLGENFYPLPWQSLAYDQGLGGYVVNVDREQLKAAPSYEPTRAPDWNDADYGRRLEAYYGYPIM